MPEANNFSVSTEANIFSVLTEALGAGLKGAGQASKEKAVSDKQNALQIFMAGLQVEQRRMAHAKHKQTMLVGANQLKLQNAKLKEIATSASMTPEQKVIEKERLRSLADTEFIFNNTNLNLERGLLQGLNTPESLGNIPQLARGQGLEQLRGQLSLGESLKFPSGRIVKSQELAPPTIGAGKTLSVKDQDFKTRIFNSYPKSLATSIWNEHIEGGDQGERAKAQFSRVLRDVGTKGFLGGDPPTPEVQARAAQESGYSPIFGGTLVDKLRSIYDQKNDGDSPPLDLNGKQLTWDEIISQVKAHYKNLRANTLEYLESQ